MACCTTARSPLFDGRLLSGRAVIVACGSHEPDAREVDSQTIRQCGVLVESKTAAVREAGEVVMAMREGTIDAEDLVTLADLVRADAQAPPRLFKTVGMGWEDLVIAGAILDMVGEGR